MQNEPTLADALAEAAATLALPRGAALRFTMVGEVDTPLPPPLRVAAPRRQRSFAAGRRAAALALGSDSPVGIGQGGLPAWPRGWLGSITHTDEVAAAVVAPDGAAGFVGIDLERIVAPALADELAPLIAPEGLSGANPAEVELTCAFSAKEALYKALFPMTREIREFTAARFRRTPDGEPELVLAEDWGEEWPEGTVLGAHQFIAAGHVLTVVWGQDGAAAASFR